MITYKFRLTYEISQANLSVNKAAEQHGQHLADIFRCILTKEKCILIQFSLQFVHECPISHHCIGLDNGLVPNKWQAIPWTNVD